MRNDSIRSSRKFRDVPGLQLMLIQARQCFCLSQFFSQTGQIMSKWNLARPSLYHRKITDLDWNRKSTGRVGILHTCKKAIIYVAQNTLFHPPFLANDAGCRKYVNSLTCKYMYRVVPNSVPSQPSVRSSLKKSSKY